jgi:signal transduction histidine kinase
MMDTSSAYNLLTSLMDLSTSSLPFENKLNQILQSISDYFHSDRCLLMKPDPLKANGFLTRLAQEGNPLWGEGEMGLNEGQILPEEKELLLPGFALLPLLGETSFFGFLYLGFLKSREFSSEEKDLLLLIAKELGRILQSEHYKKEAQRNLSELTALQEIGRAVTSTLNLENLYEQILTTGSKILKARGGVLRIEEKATGELKIKFSLGGYDQNPLDEKIAKRVFFTRTPLLLNHFGEEKASILCAPLLSGRECYGTLTFYNKETTPSTFDQRDSQLLVTMAHQTACSIENALTHHETSSLAQEFEKRAKQFSTLWELNKALLTTVNFERILHLMLTAITLGDGLGFNRAMLFMLNEKEHTLDGTMAVGPDTPEEAGQIWNALSQKKQPLSGLMAQLSNSSPNPSQLNSLVKGIRIPLEQEQCILSRTVLEGRFFNIQFPRYEEGWIQTGCGGPCQLSSEIGCSMGAQLGRNPKAYSFSTVPLWGKGKVIGVIVVDNLYNQNPITEEDLQFLSMFSNQAGLAIENAILYRNLEELHQKLKEMQSHLIHHEKMSALGELSSTIAHEIRNPLVSIGGFARRLYQCVPDEAPEKRYTQIIMTEVSRVEKILGDLLNYTRDEPLTLREVELKDILEETLSMISHKFSDGNIEVIKQYSEDLPRIRGDYHQLKHAFFNLIDNSYQAMRGEGTLSLRLYPLEQDGSSFIRVELEDTGKGIDPENLHNIFNPFYTTKDSNLGLGLPIFHKIITSHQGQIEVDNRPGEGVTFIITLPALEASHEKDISRR